MRPTDGQAANRCVDHATTACVSAASAGAIARHREGRPAPGVVSLPKPPNNEPDSVGKPPGERIRYRRAVRRMRDRLDPAPPATRQARRRAAPPPDVSFRKRNRRPDVSALRTRRAHALRGGHERPMARLSQSRLARRARVPIDVAGWSCAGSQTIGNWQGNAFFGPPQHAQKAARRCGLRALGGR